MSLDQTYFSSFLEQKYFNPTYPNLLTSKSNELKVSILSLINIRTMWIPKLNTQLYFSLIISKLAGP